ncbi:protein Wiz isoform X2 [Phyllobates terribilis]|uniref:protein Wiz isoform X2 n=1 Tax=Phyllobates terribilis TaxID=111132 RepID=UPI003CCAEB32
MEDVPSTYLSGQDDVDHLQYALPSIGQNEACAPMACPGGVEIVLVGGGEANVGAYPEEGGVLTSYPHLGYREDNKEGIRLTHSRDSDGINCGIMGRPDQDHHSSSKYTLPPSDHRTLHHLGSPQTGAHTSPWGYSSSDTHQDGELTDGMTAEDQYLQNRRYEWSSGLDDGEEHSQLMMLRSEPTPINMPAFRRALQLGRAHEAWQGGNYSEEDAHVEVEEEEEDEEGSVYTCIECNIYFKKKGHLLEHMFQHSQEAEGEGVQAGEGSHTCGECGKGFGDEESLESHRQLHQESRQKIIEEISKLENLADEGRDARLQCPKCLFGTNSSKVFVQHAKTHVRKVSGDTRGNPTSFRASSEILEGGETPEVATNVMWKSSDGETTTEQGWRSDLHQTAVQGPSKIKRNILNREDSENSMPEKLYTKGENSKTTKAFQLPEAAVKLKRRFREVLRSGVGWEEEQRQQLRDQIAVLVLENIGAKKRITKGHQPLGNGKKLSAAANKGLLSRSERCLPRDDWGEVEEDVPLDALLMDPKYASQLEALGLRSEERECPYCPDRFHNGIGLANHVRGHLNRVGVSYNVRHFISAEEVKAIEQNYSFQKKRKKVANFDPSTFSLMRCEFCGAGFDTRAGLSSHARAHLRDFGITNWELTVSPIHVLTRLLARSPGRPLPPFTPWHQDTDTDALSDEDDSTPLDLGRPQISKPDQGRVEKMASDQSGDKTEESKGPGSTTCELCGACFETRKGLSSHARSHLRHLGVPESESSGAPIDLLNELAKQGKLPKDESLLGAKKVASPQPGSPKTQWGEEDGPLNLTVEGETNRENDCQFCGAWFETRKGLSSHARAHLRHLGVNDPDAKGSPIAALNSLVKSEEFKKKLSGHVPSDDGGPTKAPADDTAKEPGTEQSPPREKEASLLVMRGEGANKGNDDASSEMSDGIPRSVLAESSRKLSDSTGPIETSAHFKCPSGSGNSTHIKIVEAGAPHILSSDVGPRTKLVEIGRSHGKPDLVRKMGSSHQPKPSMLGLAHPRPSPSHAPPTKKLKMSPPPSMEAYWSPKNVSTPLNLSPSSEEVRCEFCGEFFENRKGLSSHARSHLRQMGVTEWHVNGSPIDTLREILATGNCPRSANRIGSPNSSDKLLSHRPPSSPSRPHPFSGLSPTMQRKPQHPTFTASEWPADLSPLNLSSRADPTRDIRCEFCNEFFENRKGLSSHARSHLRQMGVTEWHVNGSPIDTLREIIRKRRPAPPQQQRPLATIKKEPRSDDEPHSPSQRLSPLGIGSQGMARDLSVSSHARPQNNFLSPMPAKRPLSHGPRQPDPRGYVTIEPKSCNQAKSYIQGEPRPKTYIQEDGRPKTFLQNDGRPKHFLQSADGQPKTFIHEGRPKGFLTGEHRPKAFVHGEHKPKAFLQGEGRPKPYLLGDGKPKHFINVDGKPKVYSPDGKPKAYIQTELPFKVKVKASPEKTVTSLEACCELCGLFFENRKALASHARAHLRQFGVTEWCVNGSPIETLREWMKQRPQKAGAYLSYIQGGRPYTKKFKRALQSPKPVLSERESPAVIPGKVVEAERTVTAQGIAVEKPSEAHSHIEKRHPKPAEIPPAREDTVSEQPSKTEEPRPPVRARPVPSLVPRPPQTSLVKFVGNIYTLKCRFCDIQFQGPLSIQEQWVRHLQHHILEMNFSKASSPPHALSPPEPQPEPAKAQ